MYLGTWELGELGKQLTVTTLSPYLPISLSPYYMRTHECPLLLPTPYSLLHADTRMSFVTSYLIVIPNFTMMHGGQGI